MPAAMLYAAVRGSVTSDAFLSAVRTAASTAPVNLTPGPWTWSQVTVPVEAAPTYSFPASYNPTDAQQVQALRIGLDSLSAAQRAQIASTNNMQAAGTGLYGLSGPFAGVLLAETAPSPVPASVLISAFKQVMINPAGTAVSSSWRGTLDARVFSALGANAFTVAAAPWGETPPGDRGVPLNPVYTDGGSTASSGALLGIFAAVVIAFVASRGSAKKPLLAGVRGRGRLGKLSTNREGLTFEEWRRAAAAPKGTPGIHAAWAKGEDPSEWRAISVASRTSLSRYL